MPRAKRPSRERRTTTHRIPESLLLWLLGEISDDAAFDAEDEPSGILSPVGVDGTWDGFDNYMANGNMESLFELNPGLREELTQIFAGMGRKPPWERSVS